MEEFTWELSEVFCAILILSRYKGAVVFNFLYPDSRYCYNGVEIVENTLVWTLKKGR